MPEPTVFMKRFSVVILALSIAFPAAAAGRKVPDAESKRKQNTTLKDIKDGANRALEEVDRGVHGALGPAKDSANKALQAVDDTLHGRKK